MEGMARLRTVKDRLKGHYHYPQVQDYGFSEWVKWSVPLVNEAGNGYPDITFRYTNTMDVVVSLLQDQTLHHDRESNFVWEAETIYHGGRRMFTRDISSGNWWLRSQAELPQGYMLLPILIYADATHLTGSGSQQAHPVMVTVGNFRWWIRQKDRAWKTVALIPMLNVSKATKKTTSFADYKMWLYHEAMKLVLKPIVDAHAKGGLEVFAAGATRRLVPVVAFYSQDSMEVS